MNNNEFEGKEYTLEECKLFWHIHEALSAVGRGYTHNVVRNLAEEGVSEEAFNEYLNYISFWVKVVNKSINK